MFGNFAIYAYLSQVMGLKLKYMIFTKGILNIDLGQHLDFFLSFLSQLYIEGGRILQMHVLKLT